MSLDIIFIDELGKLSYELISIINIIYKKNSNTNNVLLK